MCELTSKQRNVLRKAVVDLAVEVFRTSMRTQHEFMIDAGFKSGAVMTAWKDPERSMPKSKSLAAVMRASKLPMERLQDIFDDCLSFPRVVAAFEALKREGYRGDPKLVD